MLRTFKLDERHRYREKAAHCCKNVILAFSVVYVNFYQSLVIFHVEHYSCDVFFVSCFQCWFYLLFGIFCCNCLRAHCVHFAPTNIQLHNAFGILCQALKYQTFDGFHHEKWHLPILFRIFFSHLCVN